MHRDHYVVLGSPGPSPARPRRSDLDQAELERRRYPDLGEAYDVLSDGARCAAREVATPLGPRRPAPWTSPASGADALAPSPLSLLRDFETRGPSVLEIFDRFVDSFTGRHATKSQHTPPLEIELVLSPFQAARGGTLSLAIPVIEACEACGGSGRDWLYLCTGCGGRGVVVDEAPLSFTAPPLVGDGDVFELSLVGVGIVDQTLRVHFRVGA